MENEFSRIDLTCTDESLVPSGAGYGDIAHQVCTLPGSVSGSRSVSGSSYIETAFSYRPDQLWRNFGIIVALIIFFLTMNAALGEYVTWGAGGKTVTFYQKENEERRKLNEALHLKRASRSTKEDNRSDSQGSESDSGLSIESKAVLTWEDLCYDVPVPSGTRRLLSNIYGYVKPGQLTALMGASGAGKTTLLDVLAARKNIGVIGGDVLVDGVAPGTSFQRGTSVSISLHLPLFLRNVISSRYRVFGQLR